MNDPKLEEINREVFEVHPSFEPITTIPRPTSLNELEPFHAALAVGEFLGAPQQSGPFMLERFEIDKEGMLLDFIRAHGDIGNGRWACGVGTFLKLSEEVEGSGPEGGPGKRMWMSNTPQEMIDHDDVFEHATGRVLVHGLGLSCVVSGLLTNPDVEHIDVVELNPHVIEMVGPAYEREPRVTIHQGNCLTFEWPEEARWNYVWHDIWESIGPKNLDPAKAENGISYGMLLDRFADRADKQGAWAMDLAERMVVIEEEKENARLQFQEQWGHMTFEERCDFLIDYRYESQLQVPGVIEKQDRDTVVECMDHLEQLEGVFILADSDKPPLLL